MKKQKITSWKLSREFTALAKHMREVADKIYEFGKPVKADELREAADMMKKWAKQVREANKGAGN